MTSVYPPTRVQLRTDALQMADAYGSPRWDTTATGEVDRRMGMVHAREWKRILQAAPYYAVTQYTPTTDATGAIPFASLAQGTGDSVQNLYRILGVWVNQMKYEYVEARHWLQQATFPIQANVWFRSGTNLMIPGTPTTLTSGIWVNWYPCRFDQLATDQSVVTLPPDYDDIFTMESAARLLMKGGAETGASEELQAEAEAARQELLSDLSRISIDPQAIQYSDQALDWGGY